MLHFLHQVAQVAVHGGLQLLGGLIPGVGSLAEVAGKILENYRQQRRLNQLRSDIEQMLQAQREQVRQEVQAIVLELLPQQPQHQQQLATYLELIPEFARRSLTRPEDRRGHTVPPQLLLDDPAQLAQLLPPRLPRFAPGNTLPGADNWQLVRLLGLGGFGEVWLAENELGLHRAVKFCLHSQAQQRLLAHEGRLVHQVLRHSHTLLSQGHGIVPLLDANLKADPPWLAYEYVDGGDLSDLIMELSGQPPHTRGRLGVEYLIRLAEVVGQFHRLDPPVVHRDLKPGNVLLKRAGQQVWLRVADFGISQLAAAEQWERWRKETGSNSQGTTYYLRGAFTPLYASPQQQAGLPPDVRDDVYSLGVIGWQLVVGEVQRGRPTGREAKRVICQQCGLSEGVVEVLERCWEDKPEERPKDGVELAELLRQALQPEGKREGGRGSALSSWADVDGDFEECQRLVLRGNDNDVDGWLRQRGVGRVGRWEQAAEEGNCRAMVLVGDCYEEGVGVPKDYGKAMRWYRKAADAGNADAMHNIGWLYHKGLGVSQDYTEAMKWYRKAADAGNAMAMNNIGVLYQNGWGVSRDYTEAMRWFRKAADAGNAMAMNNIGWLYQNGWGVSQDYTEAMRWYRKAADAGNATAMRNIGRFYQNGWSVLQDYTEAMKWYRKAADAGNALAMNEIGWLYQNGWGVSQDYTEAMKWYRKAADAGDTDAMCLIGVLYQNGWGVSQDYTEAMRWYRKAADAGNAAAMNQIGWLYHKGLGVSQDYTEAMKWYRKAADAGNAAAMNQIGVLYHNGWGVSRDYSEAMKWFRKAADAGNAAAMNWIGWMYQHGHGVSQDYMEAMRWYRKAADAGNADAMYNIGVLYHNGWGVSQDYTEAMRWYRKAADAGNVCAMDWIGWLYQHGHGVSQDDTEAKKWYRKAADAGLADAAQSLRELDKPDAAQRLRERDEPDWWEYIYKWWWVGLIVGFLMARACSR
jgi:TPR repeat protein/serine/threonine protein kinase